MTKHDRAVAALRNEPWARELLSQIEGQGGTKKAPLGLLFELRFAFELARRHPSIVPQYEFCAGVADSSVDFRIDEGHLEWLIELVSLDQSDAVRKLRAESRTHITAGVTSEVISLSSLASDLHEAPWGELVRVSEKLGSKVWNRKTCSPQKFPRRTSGRAQVLLVDMAGFEGTGDPDPWHCQEICLGSLYVSDERRTLHPDTGERILGLFEQANTSRAAAEVRARIDLIGFVAEHPAHERDDEIARNVYLIANPDLTDAVRMIERFPVRAQLGLRNPLGMKS